ncbi:MAG: hypothetical protein ACKO67_06990 [Bacteroidota bacterium]
MKYAFYCLLLLTGCRMTPRYHQRGFQVQCQYCVGQNRLEVQPIQHKLRAVISTAKTQPESVAKMVLTNPIYEQIHQSSAPVIKCESSNSLSPKQPVKIIQTIRLNSIQRLPALNPKQKSWPHIVQINKRKDRDVRLENAAIVCYSIGLAVVLLSWLLANDVIFGLGSIALFAGVVFVSILGFGNVHHAFTGYMSILSVLGAIFLIAKFGYLDQLISALNH